MKRATKRKVEATVNGIGISVIMLQGICLAYGFGFVLFKVVESIII
tara:strand:- start:355 stop:492 length:138 start_codon:yes stop_codon:yes gene_type:complete